MMKNKRKSKRTSYYSSVARARVEGARGDQQTIIMIIVLLIKGISTRMVLVMRGDHGCKYGRPASSAGPLLPLAHAHALAHSTLAVDEGEGERRADAHRCPPASRRSLTAIGTRG